MARLNVEDGPREDNSSREFTPRACLALSGAFAGFFCTVGLFNSFGLFESYYKTHQLAHESQSTISWLGAVSLFFLYAGSLVCGLLLDIFGAKVMVYLGSFGTVLSAMMISLCERFWEFILVQGVLFGVSITLTYTPVLGVIGQHFKRRRAAAIGIVIAASSLGGVIWPIMLHRLFDNPNIGFAWAVRIMGFMMLPLLAMTCVFVRPPVGSVTVATDQAIKGQQAGKSQKKPAFKLEVSHLKNPATLLTCAAFFFIYFGMLTPLFFNASFARSKGFSDDLSFYTISMMNAASLVGRVLSGFFADSNGRFNTCVLVTFISGIISFCWSTVHSVAGLVVFSLAYGFSSGAILSLQQACAAQISAPQKIGLTIGTVMASASLSGLAGIPISGQLAGKYGYLALSIYAGTSNIVGGTLLAAARFKQQKTLCAVI